MSFFIVYTVVAWIVRLTMVPVVLSRQFAPGAAWAWLGIVFLHPYIGLTLYFLFGETRLGPRRTELHRQIVEQFRHRGQAHIAPANLDPIYEPMVLQAEKISGLPIRAGNAVDFFTDAKVMVDRLSADIDAAKEQVHLLYYIFCGDERGRQVAEALKRAAGRGVKCRVLVDAVASRSFFYDGALGEQLTAAGVQVAAAMRVATLRRGLRRMDLRNHRKLSVIDRRVGYVGSHNLIHPDYGGRKGAPWVDVTGRFTGPIIAEFQSVFCEDWAFETAESVKVEPALDSGELGNTPMQVVPTGPSAPGDTFRRVLLAAIQCARKRVTLTTPYFVPDQPTLVALMMAADRGVEVKLIMPETSDLTFAAAAGRANFGVLMDAGVNLYLYRPGLLHSKTTTVDDAFVLFGSANLDVRSFNLNFEISVLMYGQEIAGRMRDIQEGYLRESRQVSRDEWAKRSPIRAYADGAVSLISPLL